MKQFTTEEIQARFEELPPEVQQAVTSTDVQDKIKAISVKHGLHVDQFGALVEEIGLVMLGLQRSSMFVPDLISKLSLKPEEAAAISADVNTDIFAAIRKHLQEADARAEQDELHETTVPHMEQAGDMEILTDIKHPETPDYPSAPPVKAPAQMPSPSKPYVEPLVDRLLSGPSSQPAQKIETVVPTPAPSTKLPPAQAAPLPPLKPRIDPYREAF